MTLADALVMARQGAAAAAHINRRLSRIGLTLDDVRRFEAIAEIHSATGRGATVKETAAAMYESPSQCLRALKEAEKLGWAWRPGSGRFTLTDSGRDIVGMAHDIGDSAADEWFAAHPQP